MLKSCFYILSYSQQYNRIQQSILNVAIMRDEFPQIPQENAAQFQSMYQHLTKTSKQIQKPHKKIFANYHLKTQEESQSKQLSMRSIPLRLEREVQTQLDVSLMRPRWEWVALMREQIQIGSQLYTVKVRGLLNEQAKKIKYLSDLLIKNQLELNSKGKLIEQLIRENTDNSQHFQLILTSFDNKISDLEKKWLKVQEKGKQLKQSFEEQLQKIRDYYYYNLQQIQKQIQNKSDQLESFAQIYKIQTKIHQQLAYPNWNESIETMGSQIEDFKIEISSFKNKTFTYENYKIYELQRQIAGLHELLTTTHPNQHKNNSNNKINEPPCSLSPTFKNSQTLFMGRKDQLTNKSTSPKLRFLQKYKSLINTKKPPGNKTKQELSIGKDSNGSSSEVQEVMIYKQGNIERLVKIIHKSKLRKPLKLQIDQTGYAKSSDTGMYLVDNIGDGFEFDEKQLEYLIKNNIIKL